MPVPGRRKQVMSTSANDYPQNVEAFKKIVSDYQAGAAYKNPILFAVGSRFHQEWYAGFGALSVVNGRARIPAVPRF
jgi:hypothetical protein